MRKRLPVIGAVLVVGGLLGAGLGYAQTASNDSATLTQVCTDINASPNYVCGAETTVPATTTPTTLPPTTTSTTVAPTTTSTTIAPTTTTTTPPPQLVGKTFGGFSMPLEQVQYISDAAIAQQANDLVTLGAGWQRGDYQWSATEATKGVYTWADQDRWIIAAVQRGINPDPIMYMTPAWARLAGCGDDKCQPANATDYGNWMGAACGHLGPLGVKWVELWNEENLSGFFHPLNNNADRDKFVAMVKDASAKCKAAWPAMKVMVGGLSTADTLFQSGYDTTHGNGLYSTLNYYGAHGMYAVVDAVAKHDYLDTYDPGQDVTGWSRWAPAAISDTIKLVDSYAPGRNVQVWETEGADPRSANSEATQASRAAATYNAFAAGGFAVPFKGRVGPFLWFCNHDRSTGDAREDSFGVNNAGYTHQYQAWAAMRTAFAKAVG
jgi:polysaccharide biosynthesis protein PslG